MVPRALSPSAAAGLLFLLLASLLPSPAHASRVSRATRTVPVTAGASVSIDVPVAVVRLVAHQENELRLEMVVECNGELNACEAAARQVELALHTEEDGNVAIGLRGPEEGWKRASRGYGEDPSTTVRWANRGDLVLFPDEGEVKKRDWTLGVGLDIHYPARSPLDIRVGQGQVELQSLSAAALVRISKGHVLASGLERVFGTVRLASKRGQTRLLRPRDRAVQGERKGFAGGTRLAVEDGPGPHTLDVEVEIKGQVLVQLH